jgi:Sulfotransferase family
LRRTVGVPLRVLHVTRNPYDNIATMARRSRAGIDSTITRFAALCQGAVDVQARLAPDEVLHVDYEQVLVDPRAALTSIGAHLQIGVTPAYLDDCAGVVWTSGTRSRRQVEWSDAQLARVAELIDRYPAFNQYAFDD